jgi:ABC-2 type transport system ATP-binding protein
MNMSVIETEGLIKEYGPLVAVKDVSLSVEKGQVVGLVGPNGAGKTTLMRMIATLLEPTGGTARLLGHDIKTDYLFIRKHIGYLPDFFNLYEDLKISECLSYFARAYEVEERDIPEQINSVLKDLNLEEKKASFVKNLSRGMIQRLGLGMLLVHSPDIYILDEPASGLDPEARMDLRSIIKRLSESGKTVIISSHILTELSGLCSHVAIMNHGEILQFGDVGDIERKIIGVKGIEITVLQGHEKAINLIRDLKGAQITDSSPENSTIVIELEKGPEAIAELNKYLVENGVGVISLHQKKSTLEDVYLKVSSRGNNGIPEKSMDG